MKDDLRRRSAGLSEEKHWLLEVIRLAVLIGLVVGNVLHQGCSGQHQCGYAGCHQTRWRITRRQALKKQRRKHFGFRMHIIPHYRGGRFVKGDICRWLLVGRAIWIAVSMEGSAVRDYSGSFAFG